MKLLDESIEFWSNWHENKNSKNFSLNCLNKIFILNQKFWWLIKLVQEKITTFEICLRYNWKLSFIVPKNDDCRSVRTDIVFKLYLYMWKYLRNHFLGYVQNSSKYNPKQNCEKNSLLVHFIRMFLKSISKTTSFFFRIHFDEFF